MIQISRDQNIAWTAITQKRNILNVETLDKLKVTEEKDLGVLIYEVKFHIISCKV